MKPLVIYHANCTDGWTAAWIAARVLGDVELFPGFYGTTPPDVTDRDVYCVDFAYGHHEMLCLAEQASRLWVLEHHKSRENELRVLLSLPKRPSVMFDNDRSGARLAWDFWVDTADGPKSELVHAEWLVNYVQDRDLWRWALPDSRLVSAGIEAWKRDDLDQWDALASLSPEKLAADGEIIERYRQRCIEAAVVLARPMWIAGHRVLCANTSEMRFASDTAHVLADGKAFGATWWLRADGVVQFSLRSRPDGIDVSEVAKQHGGGGHKHAAGFQVPFSWLSQLNEAK